MKSASKHNTYTRLESMLNRRIIPRLVEFLITCFKLLALPNHKMSITHPSPPSRQARRRIQRTMRHYLGCWDNVDYCDTNEKAPS